MSGVEYHLTNSLYGVELPAFAV